MSPTSRGDDAALAMHGLLHVEARRCICRQVPAPAVHVLPRVRDVRRDEGVRTVRPAQSEGRVCADGMAAHARCIPSMLGLHEPGPWARNAPARHDAKGERMFYSAGPRDPVQKPGKPTAKASTGHGGKSRGPPGRHACQSRAAQA